jgi:hypothetical protein
MAKSGRKPTARATSTAHQAVGPHTSRANLCLARGLDAPSDESPPRSRAGRPIGRVSASLEGWTPHRASLRLARGHPELKAPAPTPPTRALNALTRRGRSGQKANHRHIGPLSPPGNRIPALFRQPSPCGHPRRCRRTVREGRCKLHDTVTPTPVRPGRCTPRRRTAEPSKRVRTPTPCPHGTTP